MKYVKSMELNYVNSMEKKFEEIYEKLEKDTSLELKKVIKARELFKEIMKVQIETGMTIYFFQGIGQNLYEP